MTILQTERLLLRPLAPTDFTAFRTFAADGELTKYMLFYPLEQEAELHTFLQNAAQAWNSLFHRRMNLQCCEKRNCSARSHWST